MSERPPHPAFRSPSPLRAVGCGLAVAVVVASRLGAASPTYPAELEKRLKMPCTPVCTICHRDNLGGRGTVVRGFGIDMRNAGLRPADLYSLDFAIDELETNPDRPHDADGDKVSDLDELRQGTNPNGDEDPLCSDLSYGCSVARPRPDWHPWTAVLLAAFGALWRRRRGRVDSQA